MSKFKNVDKKSEQLGMSHGKAAGRLRKNVLFSLLAKYGDNICYRCGEMITSASELSIEHKEAWLDKDPALFWDLDNIAFSHLSCNCSAAGVGRTDNRITNGNPDEFWCAKGKHFTHKDNFGVCVSRWSGLKDSCKEHINEYKRKLRAK